MYMFQINGYDVISLDYQVYFNESDKELAFFIYDIEDKFLQDIQKHKKEATTYLISGGVFYHFILDTGINKFVFELYNDKDIIKNMIDHKSIEIGMIFKKDDVLLEDLCFTIDY